MGGAASSTGLRYLFVRARSGCWYCTRNRFLVRRQVTPVHSEATSSCRESSGRSSHLAARGGTLSTWKDRHAKRTSAASSDSACKWQGGGVRCADSPSLRCWGSHCFLQSLRRAGEMTAALHQVAAPAAAPCDPLVWAWFRRGWPVRGGRLLLPRRPLLQGRHACHRKRANHQGSAKIVKDTLTVTRILGSSTKMRVESGAPLHEV